ncbi:hypothetical protein ACOME3_003898 [Neoechinorhynchus agilis]
MRITVPPDNRRQIIGDSIDLPSTGVDETVISDSPNKCGGSGPTEQRDQMISHFQTKTYSNVFSEHYQALPSKVWPFVVTVKSNPILPKQVMYDTLIAPWTHTLNNDGIKRVDKLTYFAGTMRIYVSKYEWMSNLVEFANSNLPNNLYTVSATSQKVQFLVHGLQPDMCNEDRDLFESSFGCTIKYFIKSRKSGLPISIAAVEGMRHQREDLCTSRPRAFNCFSIHFTLKSFSEQDDYVFLAAIYASNGDTGAKITQIRRMPNVVTALASNTPQIAVPTHLRGIAPIVRDRTLLSSKVAQSSRDTGRGSKIG